MKARAVPEGTKTLADERAESIKAIEGDDHQNLPIAVASITVHTQRHFKDGTSSKEKTINEEIEVKDFVVPHAEVGLSRGLTINLGSFESARIDVSIRVPCYREEIPAAYEFAKEFTAERLREEKESIRKWSESRNTHSF